MSRSKIPFSARIKRPTAEEILQRHTKEIEQAEEMFLQGNYQQALPLYQTVAEHMVLTNGSIFQPLLHRSWSRIGEIYERNGNYTKAEQYYQKALLVAPSPELYQALAGLYVKEHRDDIAAKYYQTAITLSNGNPQKQQELYIKLADIYIRQNNYGNAIQCYHTIYFLDNTNPVPQEKVEILHKKMTEAAIKHIWEYVCNFTHPFASFPNLRSPLSNQDFTSFIHQKFQERNIDAIDLQAILDGKMTDKFPYIKQCLETGLEYYRYTKGDDKNIIPDIYDQMKRLYDDYTGKTTTLLDSVIEKVAKQFSINNPQYLSAAIELNPWYIHKLFDTAFNNILSSSDRSWVARVSPSLETQTITYTTGKEESEGLFSSRIVNANQGQSTFSTLR